MELTLNGFEEQVLNGPGLVLVHFKTEWNGASQIISPIYDNLARNYTGMARFFTVDSEKEHTLSRNYGITEIPTILFFHSGRLVDHIVGLVPRNLLIAKIENALSLMK